MYSIVFARRGYFFLGSYRYIGWRQTPNLTRGRYIWTYREKFIVEMSHAEIIVEFNTGLTHFGHIQKCTIYKMNRCR